MGFLERNVNTIFIMLGTGCNFHCRYCMQGSESAAVKPLPTIINEEIYDFIEDILRQQEGGITLHFFGGEPMLYWDNIRKIVEHFEDNERVGFSCITNGSLITQERADFMNVHDFTVTVSWDGGSTSLTRGHDVFADKKRKNILFSLSRLGLSGVLSSAITPMRLMDDFQTIDNEYRDLWNYHLHINMDELFDTGIADKSLVHTDYDAIRGDMKDMTESYLRNAEAPADNDIFNSMLYCRHTLVHDIVMNVRHFVKNGHGTNGGIRNHFSVCGNGLSVLNMDVAGNLYSCHNQFDAIGDIHTPYFTYLNRLLDADRTFDFYREECHACAVYPVCRGGCKLIDAKTRHESYCAMKKAVFEPVLEALAQFGRA
ncbi:radical SAM/SPASM domain-containing protein [uncultured Mailhella sp.]|uniref:radical SAM/SPASM domain-containing protein n=1 Tax=uncultured Mailhella sp. TaxID=1981031 RepID=UPI00320A9E6B